LTLRIYVYWLAGLAGLALCLDRAAGADFDMAETSGSTRTWHEADGLLSDSVTAIVQTRDGFLWVGTLAGLVRFDGVKFTEMKLDAFTTNGPVRISALSEDSHGSLWVGTQENGLFQLDEGRWRHYSQSNGLLDDTVTSLAADNHGQVWIAGKSGLNLWTGKDFKVYTKSDGLPDEFISGVNVARSGTVWITARNGMCRIVDGRITPYAFQIESQGRSPEYLGTYEDRQGNLWAFGDTYLINLTEGKRFNYFRSSESASVRIWSLCEGRGGRIWIGTSGRGLFCFEDNRFQPVSLGESRWPYDVRAICEDREGNLWLGTSGGGLVQLRPQSVHILRAGQGLSGSSTTALALDAGGKIYVGLQRGGLFAGESGRFDRVSGGAGLDLQNFISSLCVARDGVIWAGTLGGGLYGLRNGRGIHFTTANGLADDNALAVCADPAGDIWVSTGAGTVHRFTGKALSRYDASNGLPGTPVTVMIPSATGGLWLGTQDGQILSEAAGKFRTEVNLTNSGSYPVLALLEGEAGRLWIGTAGGGLSCLFNGAVANWNTSNGLPSDIVAGVAEDQSKNLWLATGAGIYRANRYDVRRTLDNFKIPLVCKLIAEAKTLPDSTTASGGPRTVLSPDGDLWFATSEGLLNVNTHQIEIEPSVMPLYLVSAAFNGEPAFSLLRGSLWSLAATNKSVLKIPVDVRSLEIYYTALDLAAPGDIRFRHKLEGSDLDWVNDGGIRSVRYGRLPYGRYRFRLAARVGEGAWQESPDSFSFVVPTPFYLQGWAIFLFGLAGVALVAGIVRLVSHRRLRVALARLEQQQSLERERMRIARDMHDEMGSKLTKISFLSEHAQVDAAAGPLAEKIEAIAQTSRDLLQTMDEIVWVVNPHNDTLENLAAYLSHYAVEYFQSTAIECEMRLPPEIPHYPLVSEARHNLFLTFEETLNNVLKHSAASKVKVEMTLTAREFAVKVMDDGKGFLVPVLSAAPAPTRGGRGGNGLTNMRQRLVDIGGECLITSQLGQGTSVTIRIHLKPRSTK
jgi:ligand-binding sensor domain-containing protein/signal transduction histidine kinase